MAPHPNDQPHAQRALVIGIDAYPFVDAKPLRGCKNDATRIAALLRESFGFEVVLLLDAAATRKAILAAMEELVQTARPGDRVVLHFSGHGSQIKTPDGSSSETLVPYNSGRGQHPNHDITDQEIYHWIVGLSKITPLITLVFDSCHSGGAANMLAVAPERTREEVTERGLEADLRPEAQRDKSAFLREGQAPDREPDREVGLSGWLLPSESYALIAACKADERAKEIEDPTTGQHHGVLTCFLCEALEQKDAATSSHRELVEGVAKRVTKRFGDQHPQLEGAWDRIIIGTWSPPVMPFVPVTLRQGSRIELAAGAVHGLVVGSEWWVYPAGTRQRDDAEPRGRVRLDCVLAITASGELVEKTSPEPIAAGDRAVEINAPASSRAYQRRLLALCDPRRFQPLRDLLTLELWRRRPGGEWLPAVPETDDEPVYDEGDSLGIRLHHDHGAPLYVGILDCGLTGAIELLYPIRGASDPWSKGHKLVLGMPPDAMDLRLYVPAGLTSGRETLVFLLTTAPTDFGLWIRIADEQSGARETRPTIRGPETVAWAATSRSFRLRRSA